jgi:hypothetical protein
MKTQHASKYGGERINMNEWSNERFTYKYRLGDEKYKRMNKDVRVKNDIM